MQIEGLTVRVIKDKEKVKERSFSGLQPAGFYEFRPNRKNLRKSLSGFFQKIERKNFQSAVFLVTGPGGAVSLRIFSKIAAQEFFRVVKAKKNPKLKKVLFLTDTDSICKVLKKNVISYLKHLKINRGPFLTVDGIIRYKKGIILIERANPPLGWALPGGFVDYGEKLEEAVVREVKEETGLDFKSVKQFKVYSEKNRDPRFHTVSVVFAGTGQGRLKAASDAKNAAVFQIKSRDLLRNLPAKIAFDHKKIIEDFIKSS